MPSQTMCGGRCHVFIMYRYPDIPRQHGLVHRVDESIIHMKRQRYHLSVGGHYLSLIISKVSNCL